MAIASAWLAAVALEDINHEVSVGLDEQLVYGESFEVTGVGGVARWWSDYSDGSARYALSEDALNGKYSQRLQLVDGRRAGVVNQGLDQQGLFIQRGARYTGYLFAKTDSPVAVVVELVVNGSAVAMMLVNISGPWRMYDFSFSATSTSACSETKTPRVPCTGDGVCIECDGALRISLESAGSMLLDMVFLRMETGNGIAERLKVKPKILSALQALKPSLLRWGGTMSWAPGYRLKNFRGPRRSREPYDDVYSMATSAGWRLFEFLQLAEEMNATPVVNFNNWETPDRNKTTGERVVCE